MLGVENIRNKECVNLSVSSNNISSSAYVWHSKSLRIEDHLLGPVVEIFCTKSIKRALGLVKLIEDVQQGLRISEVLAKVVDSPLNTSLGQVEVDPSDQQLFWRQLVQVVQVLSLLG